MEITAKLKYLRQSPRKVRLVADLIRGKNFSSALVELRHLPKRAPLPLEKLLRSALANASHNFQLDSSGFSIKDIRVDEGPMQKRFMPRAFGRSAPIRKRTSHVTLVLEPLEISAKIRPRKTPKPEIITRDLEKVKDEPEIKNRPEKQQNPKTPKTQPRDFARLAKASAKRVRRVFRRKAI